MDKPPDFLLERESIEGEITFQPGSASRKGQIISWGSALVIGLILTIFYFTTRETQCLTGALFIFFLIAGFLITFGLWVDTKTIVLISPEYLHYKSPFRNVKLAWEQVEQVRAVEAGDVWRVAVIGMDRYFRIRVLDSKDDVESSKRFLVMPDADRLIRIICGMAKLQNPRRDEDEWVCS